MALCNSGALKLRNFAVVLAELPAFYKPVLQFAKAVLISFTNVPASPFTLRSACEFNASVPSPISGNGNNCMFNPGPIFKSPNLIHSSGLIFVPLEIIFFIGGLWKICHNAIQILSLSHAIYYFFPVLKSCYPVKGGNYQFDHE